MQQNKIRSLPKLLNVPTLRSDVDHPTMRMVGPLAAVQLPAQIVLLRVHNDRSITFISKATALVMAGTTAQLGV